MDICLISKHDQWLLSSAILLKSFVFISMVKCLFLHIILNICSICQIYNIELYCVLVLSKNSVKQTVKYIRNHFMSLSYILATKGPGLQEDTLDNNCWICGKREPMMYKCRYCGKTFCSDHRLPERHACEGLNDEGPVSSYSGGSAYSGYGSSGSSDASYGQDRGSGRGRVHRTTGSSSGSGFDNIMQQMMKDAARTAATGAMHRTSSSVRTSPSMLIILVCVISFILEIIPGYMGLFQLNPDSILTRPWTLITHMFLHASFGHLFFNMLVLFFFGRELEKRIGNDLFLYVYFISGIVAALGYSLTDTLYPVVGASGAIMGVFATLTILAPDLPVYVYFVPMKIKYALLLFVLLDFALIGSADMVAHTAHLSGALVGIFIGIRLKRSMAGYKRKIYR